MGYYTDVHIAVRHDSTTTMDNVWAKFRLLHPTQYKLAKETLEHYDHYEKKDDGFHFYAHAKWYTGFGDVDAVEALLDFLATQPEVAYMMVSLGEDEKEETIRESDSKQYMGYDLLYAWTSHELNVEVNW